MKTSKKLNWPRAVKCARAFAELEQRELAAAIGVTQSFVSNIESGTRGASVGTLGAIAKACGTTMVRLAELASEGATL